MGKYSQPVFKKSEVNAFLLPGEAQHDCSVYQNLQHKTDFTNSFNSFKPTW